MVSDSIIKFIILLILSVHFSCLISTTQEEVVQNTIEDFIEDHDITSENNHDFTTIIENLQYYFDNPLNINTATEEELKSLYILNDFQIYSLHEYIKRNGPFLSIYELQLVYGFNSQIVQTLSPFITTHKTKNIPLRNPYSMLKYGKHKVYIRYHRIIEEQLGYKYVTDSIMASDPDKNRYLGNPAKIYARYDFRYRDNLYMGFTAEKDRGEEFFKGSNPHGFDFYSFHVQTKSKGLIKKLVIGDYKVNYGQGLVAWSGFSFSKGAGVFNVQRNEQGILRYTGSDENKFLRGIGTTLHKGNFEISGFGSIKKADANLIKDTINQNTLFTSLENTGMHSTPKEIVGEDAIKEYLVGGNITYNRTNYKLGLTYVHLQWSGNYQKNQVPYNKYYFDTSIYNSIGINYRLNLRIIKVFSELANSNGKGWAAITGGVLNMSSSMSAIVVYRNYQRNYYSHYANALSESSFPNNESGLYMGVQYQPFRKWMIKSYYDCYDFPWMKYSIDAPSTGYDNLIRLDYFANENVHMYWHFKKKEKQKNMNSNIYMPEIESYITEKLRYHINYSVSPDLILSNRIEWVYYTENKTHNYSGFLVYQNIKYKPEKWPFSFTCRYAIFDSDDYFSRIYIYENNVLYGFSIPSFYYKGSRSYILVQHTSSWGMDIWIRYARTFYIDRSVIGSGLNKIDGNVQSEITLQCRMKF